MRFFRLWKSLFVIVKKGFFFFFNVIKLFFKSYFDQILIEKKMAFFDQSAFFLDFEKKFFLRSKKFCFFSAKLESIISMLILLKFK